MQYLLIISHDASFAPTDSVVAGIVAWIKDMQHRGIRRYGNPLRPPGDAKTVRVREDAVHVTDGPFAATQEKMAAYELLECADLEEAIAAATQHPMAKAGAIEVRPVWAELAGLA